MATALFVAASIVYAVGGVFMKLSNGATRIGFTIGFLTLFSAGAVLQAIGMKDNDLGASYVFVLGAEAVAAVLLSALYLREAYSLSRIAAILVVVAGIVWLRST